MQRRLTVSVPNYRGNALGAEMMLIQTENYYPMDCVWKASFPRWRLCVGVSVSWDLYSLFWTGFGQDVVRLFSKQSFTPPRNTVYFYSYSDGKTIDDGTTSPPRRREAYWVKPVIPAKFVMGPCRGWGNSGVNVTSYSREAYLEACTNLLCLLSLSGHSSSMCLFRSMRV